MPTERSAFVTAVRALDAAFVGHGNAGQIHQLATSGRNRMAIDYMSAQAMAASRATDTEAYCPECGQPVGRLMRWSSRHTTPRVWWPLILAALGLYLTLAFGIDALGAQQSAAVRFEDLRQVASWCARPGGVDPRCADIAAARGLDPVLTRLGRYAAAEREARSDLVVAAVGLLAALAGTAALTRTFAQAARGERTPPWGRALRTVWAILALGARALVPGAQLFLAASAVLVLVRLLGGAPPSLEMVDGSIRRTIELIVAVAQNA